MITEKVLNVAAATALSAMVLFSPGLSPSSAQVIPTVGVSVGAAALAGRTVGQIIQDAKSAANELLSNAKSSGNTLILRAADELNLSVENALRLFSDELDKKFDRLEEQKRTLLLGIANAVQAAKGLGDRAYTLKDTTALDVRSILGTIPFVKDKLVLQRITGLSLLLGDGDYNLRVIGSYVGLPGEDHSSELSLSIKDKKVSNLRLDPKEIHIVNLTLPNEEVKPYFEANKVVFVPAELQVTQHFKSRLWGFLWNVNKTKQYAAKLHLALYPAQAGKLKVIARYKVAGWKDIAPKEITMAHSDHCSSGCEDHNGTSYAMSHREIGNRSPQLIGDRRITSASCSHIAGPGGFDVSEGTSVSPDKSTARCQVRFRTQTTTYKLHMGRQQWDWISEKDHVQEQIFNFGELKELRVPMTAGVIRIKGTLLTGDKIDFLSSETDPTNPVTIVRIENNQNDKSIFVRIRPPEEIGN